MRTLLVVAWLLYSSFTMAAAQPRTIRLTTRLGSEWAPRRRLRDEPVNTASCLTQQYTEVQVYVGGQTLSLLLDTGSASVVVAGSNCGNCGLSGPYLWDVQRGNSTGLNASSSFIDGSSYAASVYSTGVGLLGLIGPDGATASVTLHVASITSGGGVLNVNCSAAASQPSQGASASLCAGVTALVTETYWRAGILGLGPPSMAVANTDSWLAAFFNAYDLPHVFSLQQSCSSGGVLSLGRLLGT